MIARRESNGGSGDRARSSHSVPWCRSWWWEVDEETRAPLKSVEILRRARLDGYQGGKSALYELIVELRPHTRQLMMRFEGLPGEFSQHDFGEVRISCLDGTQEVVRFFCSRLKWSRWAAVDAVPDQVAETLIRTLAEHFVLFGGVSLCAVFDRPKTVGAALGKERGSDRVESDLRLRRAGVGIHGRGVLAAARQPEGVSRESGGMAQGFVLQAAPVPTIARSFRPSCVSGSTR